MLPRVGQMRPLQLRLRRQLLVSLKMGSTRFKGRTSVVEEEDMREVDVVAVAVGVSVAVVVVAVAKDEEEAGVVVVVVVVMRLPRPKKQRRYRAHHQAWLVYAEDERLMRKIQT